MDNSNLDRAGLLQWLKTEDPVQLKRLWTLADDARLRHVGRGVHLRGLVEFTNVCRRGCTYCGLRAANTARVRYRMTREEIVECAEQAVELGYGTLVLQGGEDDATTAPWLAGVIESVKTTTDLAITLSVGERSVADYRLWRKAGADRVLLRFETSNAELYRRIHPDYGGEVSDRPALLHQLRALGYEIGSGVMVGLPGQTIEDLADDLQLFVALDLDMVGLGPYIPDDDTPLGRRFDPQATGPMADRATMTFKMMALTRLLLADSNIPSTTALATLTGDAFKGLGLQYGANVIMPNLTPPRYRDNYAIYPGKGRTQGADEYDRLLREQLAGLGRTAAAGPGNSPAYDRRFGRKTDVERIG